MDYSHIAKLFPLDKGRCFHFNTSFISSPKLLQKASQIAI
jgi:hypothetical protein